MNWRLCKSLRHMSTVISAEAISMTKDRDNKRFLFLRGVFEATRQTTKKTARVWPEAALKNGWVWRMYNKRQSTKRQERIWPVRKHLPNPWDSWYHWFFKPNRDANNPVPPAAPPLPPRLASSSIHILRNSLSFISSTLVIMVFNCASCLLKLSSDGIELIYSHR